MIQYKAHHYYGYDDYDDGWSDNDYLDFGLWVTDYHYHDFDDPHGKYWKPDKMQRKNKICVRGKKSKLGGGFKDISAYLWDSF